ncbi:MAG: autotransporter assembly complex family protein [Pseudomonadota bacterium]
MSAYRLIRLFVTLLACVASAQAQAVSVDVVDGTLPSGFSSELTRSIGDAPAPTSRLEARQRARRAAKLATDLLNSYGYFDPAIETGVTDGQPYRAMVRIDPGQQFTISSLHFKFRGAPPADRDVASVKDGQTIQVGAPSIPEQLIVEQKRLERAYRDLGYADIDVSQPDLLADRESGTVDVTFQVKTGYPVTLGIIRLEGATRTRDTFVDRLRPFDTGDLYTPAALARLSQRLSSTRHFDDVTVDLGARDPGAPDAPRDVVVQVEERPRNTLALGASVATDQGVGGLIEWTRWNLTGRADPLRLAIEASQIEQSGTLSWQLPHFPRPDREVTLQAAVFNEDTDAFNRSGARIAGNYERASTRHLVLTAGGEFEIVQERGEAEDRFLQTLTLSTSAQIDRSDDLLDPRQGWRASLSLQPGFGFGDDTSQFFRTSAQTSAYVPLGRSKRWVLANRIELGSIVGAPLLDLPVERRFFAGGGASVRGFGFQEVGPRDEAGNPTGGRSLFEASSELRWQATRLFGAAAFFDAGSVEESTIPEFEDIRLGAGLGLRVSTPAGPIRLDVAFPLDQTEFDRDVQVYFSIGQAF